MKSTPPVPFGARSRARRDQRDIVAVAALCDDQRVTQRWIWAKAPEGGAGLSPASLAQNGTLFTRDEDGHAWCLSMPYSGIWSVVPYTPGNAIHPSACIDHGGPSSWRAQPASSHARSSGGEPVWSFVWNTGDRPYGFGWGQDPLSSGPLPHTRWLQSNAGGEWAGDLAAAASAGSHGVPFSPATTSVIDDDGVGGVRDRPGSDFCLDLVGGGNAETWIGPLEKGNAVAALLNRAPVAQLMEVAFEAAGLSSTATIRVLNAWEGTVSHEVGSVSCVVPAHGAVLLILEPMH